MNLVLLATTVLAHVARWVGARIETRDGRETKVPYCAFDSQRKASSTDPSTWTTFNVARRAVDTELLPLVGFVLGDGFVGVDLDKCRNTETGAIEDWAQIVVEMLDAYTEASVSGTGVHVICRGALPPGRRRTGSIEMYDRDRFFVMTGDVIHSAPIADRTPALTKLHEVVFGSPVATTDPVDYGAADIRGMENVTETDVFQPLTDDEVLIHAASAANGEKFLALWRGDLSAYGDDHSSADLALASILLSWTRGDRDQADRLFRQSNLVRSKWTDREDYRERTFNKAVIS